MIRNRESKNTELIWVSAELAKEYKSLESVEAQERAVKKILNDKKLDLDAEQELLSESLLQFKSVCLAHRKGLEQVYLEQADVLVKLWEDMGDVTTQIDESVDRLIKKVAPLRHQVADLRKEVNELKLFVPERLVELVQQIAVMDEHTKKMLRDLLDMS